MANSLHFRSGHIGDRASFLALADLLRDIFDIDIGLLDRFGGPDPSSMPFAWFDGAGRCVANFSAFSLPLTVNGRVVRAAGYQSGAVRPDYRGRGLYRDLMQRAFAWTDRQGFEAGILLTDKPDLYRPYGFETVPQHCFRGPAPARSGVPDARLLSLDDAADLALVTAILEHRSDVSERFAARRQTEAFLLNTCFDPDIRLSHLAASDAVVAWKREGGTLRLLDVAAGHMPDLAAVVSALGSDATSIETVFPPDRIGWDGVATPCRGSCDLMVRQGGACPVPAGPFVLSPMAEF